MPDHHTKHKDALIWIDRLFTENNIAYQICGGLAVYGYGGTRDINDIDLFVSSACYERATALCGKRITKQSRRYADQGWDVTYFQCSFARVKIEVGEAAGVQIQSKATGEWRPLPIDVTKSTTKFVLGIEVPLMPMDQLLAYKTLLGREVDIQDVVDLKAH